MRYLLAAVVVLALAAPAQAHYSATSRVHNFREVAVSLLGPTVCDGQDIMTVPIVRAALPSPVIGQALTDKCSVEVVDIHWTSEALCVVFLHELTHLAGYRAPEGEEFIRPDGTPDYEHSRDTTSLMYPVLIDSFAPCEAENVRRITSQFPPFT